MVRVEIKHLEQFTDRLGKVRLYYRNRCGGGGRTPLRGPVGSPDFWEDYHAAAAPTVPKKTEQSLIWLVHQYYATAAFKQLRASTRVVRRGILNRFCDIHGSRRFAMLKPKHLRQIRDDMADRPDAANNLLKALKQVFKFAVEYNHLEADPTIGVSKLKSKNKDGHHAWTLEEVERFEDAHSVGTTARLALALLLYTGQRRSDVVRMGAQHIRE